MANNMQFLGAVILPVFILSVIVFGIFKHINVFDVFIIGANDGLLVIKKLIPTLLGIMVAVQLFKDSGLADFIAKSLEPLCLKVGFPPQMIPYVVLRPVSGGGSTVLFNDLLKTFGPDSFIGRAASIMAGSTETTFYALSVYYQSVNIKNTRHTLFCALVADFTAIIMSITLVRLIF